MNATDSEPFGPKHHLTAPSVDMKSDILSLELASSSSKRMVRKVRAELE